MTSMATSTIPVATPPRTSEDSYPARSLGPNPGYPTMLPYSVKVYPIVQTAPEIAAPSRDEWLSDYKGWTGSRSGHNQLYLHVPFCPFLCAFCPLYKVPTPHSRNSAQKQQFVEAVTREIRLYGSKPQLRSTVFHSVYFGGGTPTELTPAQLGTLLNELRANLQIADDAEITLEGVAAQMLEPGYLDQCVASGFNRVSFGAQALDPDVRRLVGRGDDVETYPALIDLIHRQFPSLPVNLEIMAGQPGQSLESLERDVEQLISWRPDSLDILYYVMMAGTKLEHNIRSNRRPSPAFGETLGQMRALVNRRLPEAGYRQVTAEAFTRSDRDLFAETSFGGGSDDAMNTVLALGPSAFGLIDGASYQNVCDLKKYIHALRDDRFPVQRVQRLTARTARLRGLMLSLVKLQIPRALVDDTWWIRRIVKRWIRQGLVEATPTRYLLTETGKLWYNHMQMELMPMGDTAWALRMFGSIAQQQEMTAKDASSLRPFEQAVLSQLKSKGQSMFCLYRLYLALHQLPFFDRRPIGFTGPVEIQPA